MNEFKEYVSLNILFLVSLDRLSVYKPMLRAEDGFGLLGMSQTITLYSAPASLNKLKI